MRYLTFGLSMILLYESQFKKKNKKILILISAFILLVFSTFREFFSDGIYAGNDYRSYETWFNSINAINIIIGNDLFFNLLMLLIDRLTGSFMVFIFVTSLLGVYSIYKFSLENSKNHVFTIFLFITFGIYELGLSAIRQSVAISIFLLAFKYIKEKKFWKYLISILIATQFHSSAIYLILVYPFMYIKLKPSIKGTILALFAFGFTILVRMGIYESLLINYFEGYAQKYENIGNELNSNYTVFIISMLVLLVIHFFKAIRNNMLEKGKIEYLYLQLLCLFAYLATLHPTLGRELQYFMPAITLVIPKTFEFIKDEKTVRIGTISIGLLFLLIYVL